jgi:hypothetical protein
MWERGNEFELWPSRFLGDHGVGAGFKPARTTLSLVGWPPSTRRVAETRLEIHKRLGQIRVLDRIANAEYSDRADRKCIVRILD